MKLVVCRLQARLKMPIKPSELTLLKPPAIFSIAIQGPQIILHQYNDPRQLLTRDLLVGIPDSPLPLFHDIQQICLSIIAFVLVLKSTKPIADNHME